VRFSRIVPLISALGAAAAAPVAAQSFEGTIWFASHRDENAPADTLIQTTKGSLVKLETRSGTGGDRGGYAVLDTKAHTMTVIMAREQKYMTMPIPAPSPAAQKRMGEISFTETSRTETVAGVSCQVYHVSRVDSDGKKKEGDGCFAKNVGLAIGNIFSSYTGTASLGAENPAFAKLTQQNMHLVKATETKDGKASGWLEMIKVDRSAVPNSAFEAPAGYTKMEMPMMPGKMP